MEARTTISKSTELAWPSLTEAVTVFVTALPPAETITREWFTGIFWLKLWLNTPGV